MDGALRRMAEAHDLIVKQIKELQESAEMLKVKILAEFPEEPGEHSKYDDGRLVTVKIGRRLEWDQEKLSAAWNNIKDLDGVEMKTEVKIETRKFDRWGPDEIDKVRAALTVKPHGARIILDGDE